MTMHSGVVLSRTSNQPMYSQIVEQVKRLVFGGQWAAGAEVPSIRTLAAGLQVSVITIKRAYAELEASGVIVSSQGKPSVVSEAVPELCIRLKEEDLNRLVRETVETAVALGVSPGDLQIALRKVFGEYET